MNSKEEYKLPKFLLSEIAVKDGSYNDDRVWITCTEYMCIVEFIYMNNVDELELDSDQIQLNFEYEEEEWVGFFALNNCEIEEVEPKQVLSEAWEYFKEYLIWEDDNLDLKEQSLLN